MADSCQSSPTPDKTSNNSNDKSSSNSSNSVRSSSRCEKSRTFSTGDFLKRAQFTKNDCETRKPKKPGSAKSCSRENMFSRSGSKDALFEREDNVRTNLRSSSSDDQVARTSETQLRSSMNRSQSFSEEALKARRNGGTEAKKTDIHGFVLVSSKIRQFAQLEKAIRPGITALQYKNDDTLESILQSVVRQLDGNKIRSLAFLGHGSSGKLVVCHDQVLSAVGSVADQNEIMEFFKGLVDAVMDCGDANARLDFLACPLSLSNEGIQVLKSLEEYVKVPVHFNKELNSSESNGKSDGLSSISEVYLKLEMLRSWSGKANQSISNFEKIRTVGKGSYGTAVLYRKKDDDSLVILKEINIHDLNATERVMAKNEVKVLSMLTHPNIISYFDSFEEDGTLWIEMEYADGGTLGQYLAKLEKELGEKEILEMFYEMVSAIKYIHDRNILHRDLKTANIFRTKEGKIKLGDFGIAKIMSTRQDANTVLGTPYYISPEMCEGKPYNEKSDIWALGCILYEMANQQKTFEGTNLPALVNKIMKGSYAPVKETYSSEFRALVRDLLAKEPNLRPSAQELVISALPKILGKFDPKDDKDDTDSLVGKSRSLLFYLDVSTMEHYQVQSGLPSKIQITEVAVAVSHVIVVSMERGIFSWGDNTYGQLGHGDQKERQSPQEVTALMGKSIYRAACGDNFTTFLSDNGLVLTCGQGEFGCLGHGNINDSYKPKLIDDLMTRNIVSIDCGQQHCAAASADGVAFTWGVGDDGRLGLGDEKTRFSPTEVMFDEAAFVRDVRCFSDGTVFFMDTRAIFACGRNDYNKIRLNPRLGFLQQIKLSRASKNVEYAKSPVLVNDFHKYDVEEISFGAHHSAILTASDEVYCMGSNSKGQYGSGHSKQRDAITMVKGFEDEQISMISCGSTFTLAGSTGNSNALYFWGTKPVKRSRSQTASESASPTQSMNSGARTLKSRKSSIGSFDDSGLEKSSPSEKSGSVSNDTDTGWKSDTDGSKSKRPDHWSKARADSAKSLPERINTQGSLPEDVFDEEEDKLDLRREQFLRSLIRQGLKDSSSGLRKMAEKDNQAIMQPTNIIDFSVMLLCDGDAEDKQYPVALQNIYCCGTHVFLVCDTTAPPSRRKKRMSRRESNMQRIGDGQSFEESSLSRSQEEFNSSAEMTGTGTVPSWIKDELERGIPVDASADASNEDSSDEEDGFSTQRIIPKASVKREHSQLSFHRRASSQSLLRHREFRHRQSSGQLPSVVETPKNETTIIDGIAISSTSNSPLISTVVASSSSGSRSGSVTEIDMSPVHVGRKMPQNPEGSKESSSQHTSLGLSSVFPRPASSPMLLDSMGKRDSGDSAKAVFSSDSGVEFTPVENFSPSIESNLSKKGSEGKIGTNGKKQAFTERQKPPKTKKTTGASTPLRERNNDLRSRGNSRGRLVAGKGRGGYAHERNIVRDEEAAKLCDELKAMRDLHEQQKEVLENVRMSAQDSEQRLKQEIEKLQQEKAQALEKLHKSEESHASAADLKLRAHQQEAHDREAALKQEITSLKSELNKQSEKLQENYGILITVQEQLLRLQQERISSFGTRNSMNDGQKQKISTHSQPSLQNYSSDGEHRVKSAVCAVM